MKLSTTLLALVAAIALPTGQAWWWNKEDHDKRGANFLDHFDWGDHWKKDKLCNKVTADFIAAGCTCQCEKTWSWHRGLGYKYTCVGERPKSNLFCVSNFCGDYSVSRTYDKKGIVVRECAIPRHPQIFGESCGEYRSSHKEVTGCDYFLNGRRCQSCLIGTYGPEANCANVAGSTFTGFILEEAEQEMLAGGTA